MPRQYTFEGHRFTVPDNATMDQVQDYVRAQGWAPAPSTDQSLMQKVESGAEDLGKGVLEGAGNTLNMGEDWAAKHLPPWFTTPIGEKPTRENSAASVERYHQLITPANTTQAVGKGIEQAGEFLLPGGAEEKGAAKLAEFAPKLGRFAEPLARTLTSAVSSGAVNKVQGGDFGTGALMGGAGRVASEGLKMAAPTLTGIAQGLHPKDYGRTGTAILNETKGIAPGTIRNSANDVLSELNPQLNEAADQSPALIPMAPARKVAGEQITAAQGPNQPKLIKGVKRMANQLMERDYEPALGAEGPSATLPIPEEVPARDYLELRRGIGKALPAGSWSPESSNAFKGPRNAIYGQMTNQFHEAVPETQELDRRISSLIPATEQPKNFFFGHALGPGVGATLAGVGGYRRGIGPEGTDIMGGLKEGTLGALSGGLAGYAVPAAMNSAARIAWSPTGQRLIAPLVSGSILQTTRGKDETNP